MEDDLNYFRCCRCVVQERERERERKGNKLDLDVEGVWVGEEYSLQFDHEYGESCILGEDMKSRWLSCLIG
jgi:hypothetical protein